MKSTNIVIGCVDYEIKRVFSKERSAQELLLAQIMESTSASLTKETDASHNNHGSAHAKEVS